MPSSNSTTHRHNHSAPVTRRVVSRAGEVSYMAAGAVSAAGVDPLGNTAKTVDTGYAERRAGRYALLAAARRLLPGTRVATCMHRCSSGGVIVHYSPSSGVAGYTGLTTCGSVWACPVCAAKIANQRRDEMNQALAWGREHGALPVMLTLTTRHGIDDDLRLSLARLKAAKKRFHQSRAWRAVAAQLVGHVTATEVTYGRHGWHPHYHVIVWVGAADGEQALALVESARAAWSAALAVEGLDCNEYGYNVQGADAAGDYVTKWGAGEELTLAGVKKAGDGGRSPLQLLADYDAGDVAAGELYAEFVQVFTGRRQLVWSRGFKDLVRIGEVSDEDAAAADPEDMEELYHISREVWSVIVRRGLQAELLAVAEAGAQRNEGRWYIDCWLDALFHQEGF